jgi:hypothetical protein
MEMAQSTLSTVGFSGSLKRLADFSMNFNPRLCLSECLEMQGFEDVM